VGRPNLTGQAMPFEEVFVPVELFNEGKADITILGTPGGSRLQYLDDQGKWADCTGPHLGGGGARPGLHAIPPGGRLELRVDFSECSFDIHAASARWATAPGQRVLRFVARTTESAEVPSETVVLEIRPLLGIEERADNYLKRVERGEVEWNEEKFFREFGTSVRAGRRLLSSARRTFNIENEARIVAAAISADPTIRRDVETRVLRIRAWLKHNSVESALGQKLLCQMTAYQLALGERAQALETARIVAGASSKSGETRAAAQLLEAGGTR